MSHPPECEIAIREGVKCRRWVDEPDGPGTAVKHPTRQGREVFVCDEHLVAAATGVAPQDRGGKVGRNDPCSCGSGLKWKRCCR